MSLVPLFVELGAKCLVVLVCLLWMLSSVSLRISSAVLLAVVGMGYCCTCGV